MYRPPVVNNRRIIASRGLPAVRGIMWLPLLMCLYFGISYADLFSDNFTNVNFRKCCADGESLIRKIDVNFNENYECLDPEVTEKIFSVVVSPLVIGENVKVQYGIPEYCLELVMEEVNDEITLSVDTCYDRLALEIVNETLKRTIPIAVTLTCAANKTWDNKSAAYEINHMRKCCPHGQSYDTQYHFCRDTQEASSEKWLVQQFDARGESVYMMDYGLHCKPYEYAVELREGAFNLTLEGSTLKVLTIGEEREQGRLAEGEWCVEQHASGGGLVARVCTRDCSIFDAFCLKKCCPIGFHYLPRRCGSDISTCVPNSDDSTPFNLSYYLDPLKSDESFRNDVLGIRSSLRCDSGKFVLNRSSDTYHLAASGQMVMSEALGGPTFQYCIETFDRRACDQGVTVDTLACFVETQQKDFTISFVAISISCVFLFLTLVVYIALPELRNLHGKTLICHVAMMLLAYCCLARVQYGNVENKRVCTMLGYGIYFGFVAAFSWLNVMCLDIWWTFGSVRNVQPLRKASAERRRFAWYSLYAWSVSVILTVTMLLLDLYPVATVLDAHIGVNICWFGSVQNTSTDWPHYIFFVLPMGIVTCVNFVLWVLTARHCHRVKSEVHRLQAGSAGDRAKMTFRADKARYVLTGKLWVVMGAGWMWELLSTLVSEPRWFWFIFDLINELQGVSIFLILVMKPKLYYLIRKKLGLEKPDSRKNGASAGRTSSTFLSRTISTEDKVQQRISIPNSTKP